MCVHRLYIIFQRTRKKNQTTSALNSNLDPPPLALPISIPISPPPERCPTTQPCPGFPRLAGQAAARLQQAARSAEGNRNSLFQLPAFESCSAETPQGKPSGRDQRGWRMLHSTLLCFSHLVSLLSEEGGQHWKSQVLHGQPKDAVANTFPMKS